MATYLVAFDKNGESHCGSLWKQRVDVSIHKSYLPIIERHAAQMALQCSDIHTVYAIGTLKYSQTVCEMEPFTFDKWIQKNGSQVYNRANTAIYN